VRTLLAIPLVILVSAAAVYAVCRATGRTAYPREMQTAVAACVLATDLSALPVVLARRRVQMTVVQVGLAATVLHMLLTIGVTVAARATHLSGAIVPFMFWTLALYWVALLILVRVIIAAIRKAAPSFGLSEPRASATGSEL
jgi:hypothetical protein